MVPTELLKFNNGFDTIKYLQDNYKEEVFEDIFDFLLDNRDTPHAVLIKHFENHSDIAFVTLEDGMDIPDLALMSEEELDNYFDDIEDLEIIDDIDDEYIE